ncbi:hypothetical protein [Kitasatospora sp. NPDC085879]|uniref:hypothetical protein n=1 Tax=Kitasatospora sp. NPDC085879 TaxID=3154769 RepID=UPI00343004A0
MDRTSTLALTGSPDEQVWQGVSNLVESYVAPRADDLVFILYTVDARDAAAWIFAELSSRGMRPTLFGMNPIHDATVEQRLRAALPAPSTARRIVLLTVERDSMSHFMEIRRALAPHPPESWSVLRIINASEEFFRHSMSVSPQTLSAINGALLKRMMPSRSLHISSSSGTSLDVEIDSTRYRWLSNRGARRDGAFMILPPGEVSTFPANINGRLVADGAFNVTAFTAADARLGQHPVTLEIEEGRVVDFSCASPEIEGLIRRCMTYQNCDRVGELGFGTNVGTQGFIAMNSHINERHPGVHIGLGQHGQKDSVVQYTAKIHLDLITSDAKIRTDSGEVIDSTDLMSFRDESHPNPIESGINEEDIDGDCCGLIPVEVERAKAEYLRLKNCGERQPSG